MWLRLGQQDEHICLSNSFKKTLHRMKTHCETARTFNEGPQNSPAPPKLWPYGTTEIQLLLLVSSSSSSPDIH